MFHHAHYAFIDKPSIVSSNVETVAESQGNS